jgi:hypothetical protein
VVESTVSKTRLDEAGEEIESKLTYREIESKLTCSNVTSEVATSSATGNGKLIKHALGTLEQVWPRVWPKFFNLAVYKLSEAPSRS